MEHYSNKVMLDLLAMNTVFVSGYKNTSAIRNQQLLMTSLNNMAVLLAESLDNMDQQNMNGSGKGSKSNKKKPGGEGGKGKSSAQSAHELQEQLNKQLEKIRQQMGKPEGSPKGQPSMSEQLARSAAQQEAIRKMMQDAINEMKTQGLKPSGDMQKLLDDMEKTEKELVNKIVNQNTLKRQQDILTRLLEHEKAELQREQEERRQSQEAKQQNFKIPEEIIKKQQNSQQETENIRKIQPILRPYYKQEVQRYFEN
jgi:chromosome segregation ATPase